MDLNKRLETMINRNKANNFQIISSIIKSDFYYLISNYFEVDLNDIVVNIENQNNKYEIKIKCQGDRIKNLQILPE